MKKKTAKDAVRHEAALRSKIAKERYERMTKEVRLEALRKQRMAKEERQAEKEAKDDAINQKLAEWIVGRMFQASRNHDHF
jgi:hypothetical protein